MSGYPGTAPLRSIQRAAISRISGTSPSTATCPFRAPAKLLAAHRESTALVVCEPKRSRTKLRAEDAILLSAFSHLTPSPRNWWRTVRSERRTVLICAVREG